MTQTFGRRAVSAGRVLIFALFLTSILLSATSAEAQKKLFSRASKMQEGLTEMVEGEDKIELYADHMDYDAESGIATLEGAVDIRFAEIRLRADKVTINRRTGQTIADGNIILEYLENRIIGERLEINLNTRLGKVYSAQAFLKPSFFLKAETLERFEFDKYRVTRGTFTSCEQEVPDWSFKMVRATIHVDNYIYLSHGSMWIKKAPVLYLPYWIYPIKPERTSGFLMPEFGADSKLGNYGSTSYFWAITDNTDATFSLSYYDKGTFGQSLQYRYVLSEQTRGDFFFQHRNEKPDSTPDEGYYLVGSNNPQERWFGRLNHEQDLGHGFRGTARIEYTSDMRYGEDYEWQLERRPQEMASEVSIAKTWSQYYFSVDAVHTEGVSSLDGTDALYEKMPEVSFSGMRQPIFKTPLFYQFSLQAASFTQTFTVNAEENISLEKKTNRFDVYPQIVYPLNFGQWLSITTKAGLRTTWYIDSSLDFSELDAELDGAKLGKVKLYSFLADYPAIMTGRKDGRVFDKEHSFEQVVRHGNDVRREIYDFSIACSGPAVHRIFSVDGWDNIDSIEHLITPGVSFDYLPAVNQSLLNSINLSGDPSNASFLTISSPDGLDNIGQIGGDFWGRSSLTYSLTNRLRAKTMEYGEDGEPRVEYRDLVSLTLRQTYDFRWRTILERETGPFYDDYSPLTDLHTILSLKPIKEFEGRLDIDYNPHKHRISYYRVNALYERDDWRAELVWTARDYFTSGATDSRFLIAKLGCSPHPKWDLYTEVNYNMVDHIFNQNNYSVTYHSQCWSLTLFGGHQTEIYTVTEDNKTYTKRESDTKVSISIGLTNVGSSKIPFL